MLNDEDDNKKRGSLNAQIKAGLDLKAKTAKRTTTASRANAIKAALDAKFKNANPDYDSDDADDYSDDMDFEDAIDDSNSVRSGNSSGTLKSESTGADSRNTSSSSIGSALMKQFNSKSFDSLPSDEADSDPDADEAFGIVRSKTAPVKEEQYAPVIGKAKDKFGDAFSALGKLTAGKKTQVKAPVSTGKVQDNFADAVNALTAFTRKAAVSTEQMVTAAMKISKEVDKGIDEDTKKLERLVQTTSEHTHATSKNVQALDAFIVRHMDTLKDKPAETKAATNVVQIATEAVDFAKAEIKAAIVSIERDEALAAVDMAKKKALSLELEVNKKARGIDKNAQSSKVEVLDLKVRNTWLQAYKDEIKVKQAEAAVLQKQVDQAAKEAEAARIAESENVNTALRDTLRSKWGRKH